MKQSNRKLGQFIFDNHHLEISTDEFFNETALSIGIIVQSFNSLDALLNSTICQLINDRSDEQGAIIIYKLSFASKIDLFYRLTTALQAACNAEIPCFKSLIDDLKKCATLRNAVVHAEWESVDDLGYTFVKMHFDKSGMRQHYWQFTLKSLEEIDELIHSTYMLLDKFENERQVLINR